MNNQIKKIQETFAQLLDSRLIVLKPTGSIASVFPNPHKGEWSDKLNNIETKFTYHNVLPNYNVYEMQFLDDNQKQLFQINVSRGQALFELPTLTIGFKVAGKDITDKVQIQSLLDSINLDEILAQADSKIKKITSEKIVSKESNEKLVSDVLERIEKMRPDTSKSSFLDYKG